MVRQLNETFDDSDYDFLLKHKAKRTWKAYIMEIARKEIENG